MPKTQLDIPKELDAKIELYKSLKQKSRKDEAIVEILTEALRGLKLPPLDNPTSLNQVAGMEEQTEEE